MTPLEKVHGGVVNTQHLVIESHKHHLEDGCVLYTHEEAPISIPPPVSTYSRLTPEQIEEVRRLRSEDPNKWTQQALAKQFNIHGAFVARIAPAPKERFAFLAEMKQIEELKRVFESVDKKKNKGSTGQSVSALKQENREKFQKMVSEAGSLKKVLKHHNTVPKRKQRHMKPPLVQLCPEDQITVNPPQFAIPIIWLTFCFLSFSLSPLSKVVDESIFQPGVVGPAPDFGMATQKIQVEPILRKEGMGSSVMGKKPSDTRPIETIDKDEMEKIKKQMKQEAKKQNIITTRRSKKD